MKEGLVYKLKRGVVYGIGSTIIYGGAFALTNSFNPLNLPLSFEAVEFMFEGAPHAYYLTFGLYMTAGSVIGSLLEKSLEKISKTKAGLLNYITKKIRKNPIVKGLFYGAIGSAILDFMNIANPQYAFGLVPRLMLSINAYMILSGGTFGALLKLRKLVRKHAKESLKTTKTREGLEDILAEQ